MICHQDVEHIFPVLVCSLEISRLHDTFAPGDKHDKYYDDEEDEDYNIKPDTDICTSSVSAPLWSR